MPAGTYTIEEISDSGAKVDGKPFVTGSTTYELNGEELAKGTQIDVKVGESYNVTVYNTAQTGSLVISNTVDSDKPEDHNEEFNFTVTLLNPDINESYGDMTFINGVATFTLKHNQSKEAYGLRAKIGYTVTVEDKAGFILENKTGDSGTIPIDDTATASFTHKRKATIPASPTPDTTTSPSGYSGPSLWYIGGNTFGTSTTKAPTKVEIDGAAVPFTMDGSKIIVSCINADAGWVTARWGSTTNTVNFTPDAAAYCTQVSIPKTGDMPLWAAIAAFLGF